MPDDFLTSISKITGAKPPAPASSSVDDSAVQSVLGRMRGGESGQESGGNTRAVNPDSGALGQFQVMPLNVPAWTKQHYGQTLTPEQFKANPQAQQAVFNGQMGQYVKKALQLSGGDEDKAIRMAAAAWYGPGEAAMHRYNDPTPQYYNGRQYPSFRDYTSNVLKKSTPAQSADDGESFLDSISRITGNQQPDFLSQVNSITGGSISPQKPAETNLTAPKASDIPPSPPSTTPSLADTQPVPYPETPQTIESQIVSTMNADSPRSAVLLTDPNQMPLLRNVSGLTQIKIPEGTLVVNSKKLGIKPADVAAYVQKNGFAGMIGKVDDVGNDTAGGTALVTKDAQGNELSSSIVTSPGSAVKQAEVDRQQFPQASTQKIVPAQAAVADRASQAQQPVAKPQYTDADFTAWAKVMGVPKTPKMREKFEEDLAAAGPGSTDASLNPSDFKVGETPVTSPDLEQGVTSGRGTVVTPRVLGKPTDDDTAIDKSYNPDPAVKDPKQAFRAAMISTGKITPEQADALINKRIQDNVPLLPGWEPGKQIGIPYYIIGEATGENVVPMIRQEQAESRQQVAGLPPQNLFATDEAKKLGIDKTLGQTIRDAIDKPSDSGLGHTVDSVTDTLNAPVKFARRNVVSGLARGGADASNMVAGGFKYLGDLSDQMDDWDQEAGVENGQHKAGEFWRGLGDKFAVNPNEEADMAKIGDKGYTAGALQMLGQMPSLLARMAVLPGGPVIKFASDAALQARGRNLPKDEIIKSALENGVLAAATSYLAPGLGKAANIGTATLLNRAEMPLLEKGVELATVPTAVYASSRAFGNDPHSSFENAVLMTAFHTATLLGGAKKAEGMVIEARDADGNAAKVKIEDGKVVAADPDAKPDIQAAIPKMAPQGMRQESFEPNANEAKTDVSQQAGTLAKDQNVPATQNLEQVTDNTGRAAESTQQTETPAGEVSTPVAPETPKTVTHPDENINGKEILSETKDGRVVVANPENQSGISIVKNRETENTSTPSTQPENVSTNSNQENGFNITAGNEVTREGQQLENERRKASIDPRTGLGSASAWAGAKDRVEADPDQEVIQMDVSRMKLANDAASHDAVDKQVLAPLGDVVRQVLAKHGIDERNAFTPKGDELYLAVPKGKGAEVRDDIEKAFGRVDIEAEQDYTNERTGESVKKGDKIPVTISGGVGENVKSTEAELQTRKAESKNANPIRPSAPDTLAKFVTQKVGGDWYVSDRPSKSEDAKGRTRIKQSDYKKYEEEFNATPEGQAATAKLRQVRDEYVAKNGQGKEPPAPEQPEPVEPKKPNERSLPKTFEAAEMEKGSNLTYEPETIKSGIEQGRANIAEKGLDGAMEYVRHGSGIDWAPTGYAVLERLRDDEAKADTPEKAAEIREKRLNFLDEFSEEATKKGQAIVGVKAIEEFAPDRAAYLLNKESQRSRGRRISTEEEDRITKLGTDLAAERDRSKALEAQLEEANKRASKTVSGKSEAKKTRTYLDDLEDASNEAKKAIVSRLSKLDLQGLKKEKRFEGQKGAIGEQKALPGDAELLAQYAAGRLHKLKSVDELNKELVSTFGKEVEDYLPQIRQRAYQIRQEARIAALEAADTSAKQRSTIIQDIRNEIKQANDEAKARETEAEKNQQDLIAKTRKAQIGEARETAKKAVEEQRAKDKALVQEARQQAKDFKRSLIEAKKAEDKGYRASIAEQRAAAKQASLWDTPIRNMAAEAKGRLENATPGTPDVMNDLASVGAEKFLRPKVGGVPSKTSIRPSLFYREMEAEYPELVTKKNRGEIYKQAYQRVEDATQAAREDARLRSASAESKKIWEEQGMDVDKQALLIQRAANLRKQQEIRSQMAHEFARVSQSRLKRIGKEILNLPRATQTSLNMHLGRQGLFSLLTHPIDVTLKGGVKGTVQGFFSGKREDFLQRVNELKQSPGYDLAERAGVNFAELPGISTNLKGGIEEDELQSSLAQKLPWVRRSTQGFILGMNSERLRLFNRWANVGDAQGYTLENNPKFYQEIAGIVNDATGRGVAPKPIENAMKLTNQIMYSNRLKVSQVKIVNDLLNPWKYYQYDPATRKIMVQEAIKTTVALTAAYAALIAMGGKATDDPDDPDFFKVTFGHTHYDLTGGAGATFRFAYRFLKGIALTAAGRKLQESDQPLNLAAKFARNKLAPWPSAAIDYLSGKNAVGETANFQVHPTEPIKTMRENIAARMLVPIVIEDFANGIEDGGWTGAVKTAPVLAGMSEQTYAPKRAKQFEFNLPTAKTGLPRSSSFGFMKSTK